MCVRVVLEGPFFCEDWKRKFAKHTYPRLQVYKQYLFEGVKYRIYIAPTSCCLEPKGIVGGVHGSHSQHPEGPSTQISWYENPKTILGAVLGTSYLCIYVLGSYRQA